MERWLLGALVNGAVALAYVSISMHILRGVRLAGSYRANPLGTATGLIFATCAAGHFGHVAHLLDPSTQEASAQIYDWHLIIIDGITAVIAVWYWTLRRRLPALVRGVALFEDLSQRRGQALAIHDQIVQQLVTAKLAIELGERADGLEALDRGIESAREIVTDLVGNDALSSAAMEGGRLRPELPR